ncbi:MAG: transcription antitermination factor NusB [Spirochaetes bacterium]|nr:transcription antitermination factor NusB [Spirochaetota bacterium]
MNTKTKRDYINHRKEGRIIAFQTLFSYDFNQKSIEDLLKFQWLENEFSKEAIQYADFLIKGTIENLDVIDKKIKSKLKNWDFERISNIDKAILRFSIFSMLFEEELSEKIIINEAVEIVKDFGTKDSYKFVNGILDAVKRFKESG